MAEGTQINYCRGHCKTISNGEKNGPMPPFIIDDVLVHFDDDRSLAALQALIDLSQQTQIIFFTHHYHLSRLIKKYIDTDAIHIHHLQPNMFH